MVFDYGLGWLIADYRVKRAMKRWYIIHAYSGYEKQVMRSLKERIQRSAVADSLVMSSFLPKKW